MMMGIGDVVQLSLGKPNPFYTEPLDILTDRLNLVTEPVYLVTEPLLYQTS